MFAGSVVGSVPPMLVSTPPLAISSRSVRFALRIADIRVYQDGDMIADNVVPFDAGTEKRALESSSLRSATFASYLAIFKGGKPGPLTNTVEATTTEEHEHENIHVGIIEHL
eukprot:tig00000361_g24390.t1